MSFLTKNSLASLKKIVYTASNIKKFADYGDLQWQKN